MQSINKIHVNSSTVLSLNDRFTMIQTDVPSPKTEIRRSVRNRSSSVPRSRDATGRFIGNGNANRGIVSGGVINNTVPRTRITPRNLLRNRNLTQLLDLNQKLQAALKLKRRSVKQQTMSDRVQNRNKLRRAMNTIRVGPSGRLRRANSKSNIRTMRADLVGLDLVRSNSSTNLANRLGRRQSYPATIGGPRRKLNRSNLSNLTQRRRSVSRQSLSRANVQTQQLRRSNSKVNLRRSNSKLNLAQQTNVNNNTNAVRRSRSRTRPNIQNNNRSYSVNNRIKAIRQSNSRVRNPNKINNANVNNNGQIIRGRVFKRRNTQNRNVNGGQNFRTNQNSVGIKTRNLRAAVNRTRRQSLNRGQLNQKGNNGNRNISQNGRSNYNNAQGQRRSRSQQRRRPVSGRNVQPSKTKEQLDKELEQYMVNTKPQSELDSLLGNL